MRNFILILLLFSFLSGFSRLDSLRSVLYKSDEKQKIEIYNQIGDHFYENERFDSAVVYFRKKLKLSDLFHLNIKEIDIYYKIGRCYYKTKDLINSEKFHEKHLEYCLNDTNILYIYSLNNLGNISYQQGKNYEALDYYFKAQQSISKTNNKLIESRILGNIGNVYQTSLRNFELALDYYFMAYNIAPIGEEGEVVKLRSLVNIASIYSMQNEFEKAKEYLRKATNRNKKFKDEDITAAINHNLGEIYRHQNKTDSALIHFFKAYNLYYNLNDKGGLSKSLISIAGVYQTLNKVDSAFFYYSYALINAKNQNLDQDILDGYFGLSKMYFEKNEFDSAYSYLNKYIQFKDSIYTELENKKIATVEMESKFSQIEKENELLKQKSLNQQLDADRHRAERLFWIIISSLVLLIAVILYNRMRIKQRTSRRLREQSIKLEQLSIILNKTQNAILIMDKYGNFEWMNEEFVKLSGYTFDDYRRMGVTNLKEASFYEDIEKILKECRDKKTSVTYTAGHITKSGKDLWLQTTLTPVLDDKGSIIQLVAVDSDITALKEAEKEIQEKNKQLKDKNKQLIESESSLKMKSEELRKLAAIASKTDNAVSIMDAEGRFIWVNEGFYNLFGYSLDEFLELKQGNNLADISSNPRISAILDECKEQKKSITYSSDKYSKWGKHLWLQTTLTPVMDDNGDIANLIAIDSDITSIKIAEKEISKINLQLEKKNLELNRLSIVASKTDNSVMIMDAKGNFQWANDGFTRMYGYAFEEYTGLFGGNIITTSSNPNIRQIINSCINNKESFTYTSYSVKKTGEKVWLHTTLTPVINNDGDVSNIVVIESNINALKQAEEEIRLKNMKLQETNKKLMESQENLEELNAMKDKFFSIVAHDLRSPISSFLAVSDYLSDPAHDVSKDQMIHFARGLNDSASHLHKLLENLLQWSISQTGGMIFKPENIEVDDLLRQNIELVSKDADKKKITINNFSSEKIKVFADINMINTVFRNLINNAIKFSNIGGKIDILVNRNGKYVEVSINDDGIGMTQDNLNKLFRIDIRHTTEGTMEEKGTGLGLILCKELIEKNGGKIKVKSKEGQGTSITVALYKSGFSN